MNSFAAEQKKSYTVRSSKRNNSSSTVFLQIDQLTMMIDSLITSVGFLFFMKLCFCFVCFVEYIHSLLSSRALEI